MLSDGDTAPDFELESSAGGSVSLAESLRYGPTVVLFNRGTWCSYCAEQLQTYSVLEYDLWRNHGVTVLPVLPADPSALATMRDRFDLRLQLLADPTLETTAAYTATEETERHGEIPVATAVVVDEERTVRYLQAADHPADRTYANWARHFISGGFERPYT